MKETYALSALVLYTPTPGEAGAQRDPKSGKGLESWDRGTVSLRSAAMCWPPARSAHRAATSVNSLGPAGQFKKRNSRPGGGSLKSGPVEGLQLCAELGGVEMNPGPSVIR